MTVTAGYLMPGETLDQAILRNGPACGLVETAPSPEPSQGTACVTAPAGDAVALLSARLTADRAMLVQIRADIAAHETALGSLRDAEALYASLVEATRNLIEPTPVG